MPSFFEQDPKNPYLPSGGQQLSQLLMSLGAGFSMAGANNQPWWAGIAPGAAMYGQAQQQAQQNALAMQQRDENLAYRKLQEELLRSQIDEKKAATNARMGFSLADQGVGSVPGPGMGVPPKSPTMGPQSYDGRVAGYEGGSKNGGMVYNELGSGAFGPFQFMPGTWADVRAKNPQLNLPEDMTMPGATPEQRLATHQAAHTAFKAGNAAALQAAGFEPTPENLYLAHRFGAGGATTLLRANPNALLADVLPREWQAQNPDMRGQTVGGFRRLAGERMQGVGVPYVANGETTSYTLAPDSLPPFAIPGGTGIQPGANPNPGVSMTPVGVPTSAPPPQFAEPPQGQSQGQPQPGQSPVVRVGSPLDAVGQPPLRRVAPMPPLPPNIQSQLEAAARIPGADLNAIRNQAYQIRKDLQAKAQAELDYQHEAEKTVWEKQFGNAERIATEQRAVTAKIEEEKRAAEREAARRAEDAKGEGSYEYINGRKVWVSKAQRAQGGVTVGEAPKVYEPGSKALNYQILARGQMDPEFAKSPEYAAAYAAVEQEPIDVGGGEKRTPNMQYYPKPQAPVMNPEGAPKTTGQKAYTEAQSKDYTFASRLDNALPEFEKMLRDKDGKYSTANLPSSWERMKMDSAYYPDSQLTPETKAFRRVSKDIVTAILRKESGASIPLTEYPAEYAKYIPQPGDSHEEIAAKLKAIRLVARTFVEGSGRPTEQFKNIYGDEGGAASKSAPVRINLDGTPAK